MTDEYTADVIVQQWRLLVPDKLAGGLLVIQPPCKARRLRQRICDDPGRIVAGLQGAANAQATGIL